MSTYYYMICEDHKERVNACSWSGSNYGVPLIDSNITLMPFIATHHGCNVRIVSEAEDESHDDLYEDWTKDNYKEMALKDRDSDYPDA